MKKIPTIFKREEVEQGRGSLVLPEWVDDPDVTLVREGKARATVKLDGTSCLWDGTRLFKRREVRPGHKEPREFVQVDFFNEKRISWVPVDPEDPSDRWHVEALEGCLGIEPGTYELIGPKVGSAYRDCPNHRHALVLHGDENAPDFPAGPLTFEVIRGYLQSADPMEGIVWWALPDGRPLAKIKRKDFGLPWPVRS
jgi:hypothetical protein